MDARSDVVFYLNGRRTCVRDADPSMLLIEYLRERQLLTGTKLGCGEGGCGACTVTVSRFVLEGGGTDEEGVSRTVHSGINSCLAPLCSVDACHVTTVEGIGTQSAPHPVQARISACHGSQCGFCTPGIVMALYSKLQNDPQPSLSDIEETFDGNLCRCTGYRPIIDAAKTFARDQEACPVAPSGAEAAANNSNAAGSRKRPIVSTSLSKLSSKQHQDGPAKLPPPPSVPDECLALAREPLRISRGGVTWHRPSTLTQLLALKQAFPNAKLITGNTEVGIETRFKNFEYPNLIHTAAVPELGELWTMADGSVHVGGGVTLTRLEHHLEHMIADAGVAASSTRGFRAVVEMLKWFASGQIRNVASLAGNLCTASPISDLNPVLMSLGAVLTLASEGQATREVAVRDFFVGYRRTAMTAHEILLSVRIPATSEREFVRCYKQARRRDDDISVANACFRVVVDAVDGTITECTTGFGGMAAMTKPSPSLEAALRGKSVGAAVGEAVDTDLLSAALAEDFKMRPGVPGGMGAYRETLAVSFGVKFLAFLRSELADRADAQARDMARTFLRDKRPITFGVQEYLYDPMGGGLQHAAGKRVEDPDGPTLHAGVTDASSGLVNGSPNNRGPVGQSVMHRSALAQCTGEAKYVDDMPSPPKTMHARFVLSQQPSGRIAGVDLKAAEAAFGPSTPHGQPLAGSMDGGAQPGFYFFSASDISYKQNKMGPVRKDEQLFRSTTVTAAGQPVGLIVAETAEIARKAAVKCKILYMPESPKSAADGGSGGSAGGAESKKSGRSGSGLGVDAEKLPPVAISIDDAVACGRLHETRHCIVDGDPDAALARADLVRVSGTVRIGGQEHFYLECNAALAVPGEGGREMEVFASTQTTTKTHKFAAQVCGLPESRVVVRMKRMGGAFGGKETRSVFASTAVALAAHRLNIPVRINLDRDVDMLATGTRHPFQGKYRCAADRETGKIVAVDIELFSNAGFSTDLSESVMDRALFHCVNAYKVPNVRVQGNLAMTNTVTNTAFRGFGGPQGMLVCETFVEHIAKEIGMDVSEVRRRNMYKEGDLTHYGQPVTNNPLERLWSEIHRPNRADVATRRASVATFNAEHRWRKRGLAVVPTKFGINFTAKFLNQAGALVHIYTDGTVLVSHGGTEMGQGLHTKMIQIAARALGITVDRVHIAESSTSTVPNASPTAASASSDMYGMAVLNACEQLQERLEPYYASAKRTAASAAADSKSADGPASSDDKGELTSPEQDLSAWGEDAAFGAAVMAAYFDRVNLSAQGFYRVPGCGFDWDREIGKGETNAVKGTPFNYFTFGMSCSEVEIDVLTGDMRVIRADVIMDMGNPLNPAIDIGQIEGAFVQGMGWCMLEECVWGAAAGNVPPSAGESKSGADVGWGHTWLRPGQCFTRGPGTYKIPSFNDVPVDLRVTLIGDTANPKAVHSSKAIGEPPFFTASSVFFATREAIAAARADHAGDDSEDGTSFFMVNSPLTAERIRMACGDSISKRTQARMGVDTPALFC